MNTVLCIRNSNGYLAPICQDFFFSVWTISAKERIIFDADKRKPSRESPCLVLIKRLFNNVVERSWCCSHIPSGVCKKEHTFDVCKSVVCLRQNSQIHPAKTGGFALVFACYSLQIICSDYLLKGRILWDLPFFIHYFYVRTINTKEKPPYRDFSFVCFKFFIREKNLKCLASIIVSFLLFI